MKQKFIPGLVRAATYGPILVIALIALVSIHWRAVSLGLVVLPVLLAVGLGVQLWRLWKIDRSRGLVWPSRENLTRYNSNG